MLGQLAAGAGMVWLVLTVNFLLPRLMPGDPLLALQDPSSSLFVSDEASRVRLLASYGLDRPLGEQYLAYLAGLARGDLGWSIRFSAPVTEVLLSRLPWTLLLVLPSLLVASAITILGGVEAGWRRGSTVDGVLVSMFSVIRTLPVYVIGIAAILIFSVQLGWLPLSGATTPFRRFPGLTEQALDILRHWLLPAAVLTAELAGGRFLLVRNSMVTIMGEEYFRVARAKGLPERDLKYRHGLRNALLPFTTSFAAQLGMAVSGAIFVEALFAYPGMGRLMVEAVAARDYPLLQGAFVLFAVSVLAANRLADLVCARLDPRTRLV